MKLDLITAGDRPQAVENCGLRAKPIRWMPHTAWIAAAACGLLAACAGPSTPPPSARLLDGAVAEWDSGAVAEADPDWLYLRFSVEGEPEAIQAANETLSLWLDLDANRATGWKPPQRAFATLGVDLELQFSPRNAEKNTIGSGVRVVGYRADGSAVDLKWHDVMATFSPTYASAWYEARLSRHSEVAAWGLPTGGFTAAGTLRGTFVTSNAAGTIIGYADLFSATTPARNAARPTSDAGVPARTPGALRVLSWNILHDQPLKTPAAYGRIIRALDPDVVLLQEWDTGDSASVAQWFVTNVDAQREWHAVKLEGAEARQGGVAIVSTRELTRLGPGKLALVNADGKESPVRAVTAALGPPANGPTDFFTGAVFTSVHLKCCGSAGGPEDQRRLAEARAINNAVAMAIAPDPPPVRLIAGDFNLVGTRPPLDLARADLDADGSDLAVAEPRVLGDSALYTWWDEKSPFTPGRLDYVLYSDSTVRPVRALVFDTWKLSDAALARLGLERSDSSVSDHLPILIDLAPAR